MASQKARMLNGDKAPAAGPTRKLAILGSQQILESWQARMLNGDKAPAVAGRWLEEDWKGWMMCWCVWSRPLDALERSADS